MKTKATFFSNTGGNNAQTRAPDYLIKSRGSHSNMAGRFARSLSFFEPNMANTGTDEPATALKTDIQFEHAKSIITHNQSPDVPFNRSINPYRGCEHGCSYCFARPSHSYLDLSPGLDFESKLFVKENTPELLVKALMHSNYHCEPIGLGMNTDCYQPIEKHFKLTRRILEICLAFKQPITIVTKGSLILRDIDLLSALAERNLIRVAISVTTMDNHLKAIMEPRAAGVSMRFNVIESLIKHHVPVSVLMAPIIPKVNDCEIESIVKTVANIGVQHAGYVMLRLPHELVSLFAEWVELHFPLKAKAILNTMKACHNGELYRSDFGTRQKGTGEFSELIEQRFILAAKNFGINNEKKGNLNCEDFAMPKNIDHLLEPLDWQKQHSEQKFKTGEQLALF